MHKRIKEIASQANAWYPMGYPSGEGGDDAWKNLVIFEKEDLEKFAELIIKECAYIAARNQSEDMGWDISEIIKEHFGLK